MGIPVRARLLVSKMLRQYDPEVYDTAVYGVSAAEPAEPPAIADLVPDAAILGEPSFTLHVMGGIFAEGSIIVWNHGEEATVFVSDTELTTGVNMETATIPGEYPVQVKNPDGTLTEPKTFTLSEPPPPETLLTRRGK